MQSTQTKTNDSQHTAFQFAPLLLLSFLLCIAVPVIADDWPQCGGPQGDFHCSEKVPTSWSVVQDKGIIWRATLPETGQSTPVIADGKVFYSTYEPLDRNVKLGKDIIAWCCDASNGNVLWKHKIPGQHNQRISGCFGDSTSQAAVCDVAAKRVVFFNVSGGIVCFDFAGKPLWKKESLSANRGLPFLNNGRAIYTKQTYPPEKSGKFSFENESAPKERWTQLQALDMATGEVAWTTDCGMNMASKGLPQKLSDGRDVLVIARGGGHALPEKPFGISLIDLRTGSEIWSLEFDKFSSEKSFHIRKDQIHFFHEGEHLSVDATNGEIVRRIPINKKVTVRRFIDGERVTKKESFSMKKGHVQSQASNLLVGKFHYFRCYTRPWLGRLDVDSGVLEFLELPLQLSRSTTEKDKLQWFDPAKRIEVQAIVKSEMKNSRGFHAFDDPRSRGTGWGHVSSPVPSVAGNHLYIPVMNGTVYVIKWNAEKLDETALIAMNDLGAAGKSWTRASLSFANGKIFAHTMRELICIGEQ